MNIKKIYTSATSFMIRRIVELFGVLISIFSLLLFLSLTSYAPEDPNFIYNNETKIQNLLGLRGSLISDIMFQSLGLVSLLLPFTFLFTGINIFRSKKILLILENIFFAILYSLIGSIFLSFFYSNSFWLNINGNGGFVGNYLNEIFFRNIININENFFYYIILLIVSLLFLLSINFNLKSIIKFLVKNFAKFKFKKDRLDVNNQIIDPNFKDQTPLINENRVQEDLPFIKNTTKNKIAQNRFKLPPLEFLIKPKNNKKVSKDDRIDEGFLEKILLDFGVEGKIKKVSYGPVVTLNEFEPAAGVKVSKIISLSEDIARNTSSESARISMIPGSSTIGIELPNSLREDVFISEIISNNNFSKNEFKLPIALGKNISGSPITSDLSSMPHLLIAGTTGSGKSVCINTIILSLLYKHPPEKCKFILIDPKMLELSTYEGVPHLLCPVITEAKRAASVLGWVVKEMENRYRLMTKEGVKNIDGYNSKHKLSMPYIVVIVDEMSDLMLVHGKEIEGYIQKLSQMARAAGIHIIMATQRPSVDVITGTIKANFPTRISFQVTSKIDSRTILGEQGAEQLLGKGDMLFMSSANKIVRIHAPYVSENEIEKVNNFLRSQAEPDYVDEILNFADEKEMSLSTNSDSQDELYEQALDIIKTEGKASTSFLQRKLQIGYNRAARIIDMMESNGEVSKANHVGKREVLK